VTILSLSGISSLTDVVLVALVRAIETRDSATHEHSERVRHYARALATQADITDPQMLHTIQTAALLHDVGKLALPDRLLNKPGPLTPGEYEQVKRHATIGGDILSGVLFPGPLALLVRHHHENWDGTGYPDGRRRDDIPLGARVLAIGDCYDALTSNRPYRRALAHDSAIAMIFERRGTMFDPQLTDAFLQIVWRLRPVSANGLPTARQPYAPAPHAVQVSAR
jgi:HD-GYP domain-containing protein (c-di-GMP phosphodiesterase class II)